MNDDEILAIATPLIKQFEGFSKVPYLDSVKIPTIGYGTTYYMDGTRVTMNDPPISEAMASNLLSQKLRLEFLPGLHRLFSNSSKINSNQYAALLSFAYNEGLGNLGRSTLAGKVIAGDYQGASDEFPKWDMAGGQHLNGLKNRRLAEQVIWNTAV